MGPDLTSKRWIIAKGILFALLTTLAGVLIVFADLLTWQRAVVLAICLWAACRFYYSLFHVLHAYVDPSLPSTGVINLVKRLAARRRS